MYFRGLITFCCLKPVEKCDKLSGTDAGKSLECNSVSGEYCCNESKCCTHAIVLFKKFLNSRVLL